MEVEEVGGGIVTSIGQLIVNLADVLTIAKNCTNTNNYQFLFLKFRKILYKCYFYLIRFQQLGIFTSCVYF